MHRLLNFEHFIHIFFFGCICICCICEVLFKIVYKFDIPFIIIIHRQRAIFPSLSSFPFRLYVSSFLSRVFCVLLCVCVFFLFTQFFCLESHLNHIGHLVSASGIPDIGNKMNTVHHEEY